MKRRHLSHHIHTVVARARSLRPELVFGADFIAGFPTESDEDFRASLELARAIGLTFLHVFPYSIRPGTVAARMPQLPASLITERARQFRQLGEALRQDYFASRLGQVETIVLEEPSGAEFTGHTDFFAPVRIAAAFRHNHGAKDIVQARVTGYSATQLHATLIEPSEILGKSVR